MNTLTIGHIDSERTWRGGQKQVIELIRGLNRLGQRNILFCRPGSSIAEHAAEAGIETVTLPLRGEWDMISVMRLRKAVRTHAIDILHTHSSHAHTIALLALIGNPACRLVVSRRVDFHIRNPFSRTLKYSKRVSKIITVSDAIRRILIEDGIDPELVVTIRSGFVPGQFIDQADSSDLRNQLGIASDTVVISMVAALAPHKAHRDLLKAANQVVRTHPNVRFLLAGDGELHSQIEEQVINLGLEQHVTLLGFIDDVGAVYRASDIFALSSEEEGLCTSLLDAMYFTLPIVATSAGGIPELVQDQSNGFIVPVHDYLSFAERLTRLIDSPELREKMGARSTAILDQHSVEQTIARTLDLYFELSGRTREEAENI